MPKGKVIEVVPTRSPGLGSVTADYDFEREGYFVVGELSPGQWVRHPTRPDWGIGQVQSAIGKRVTVNFEHAGKHLIDIEHVSLETIENQDG